MKKEHKEALSDGSTFYDREGQFVVAEPGPLEGKDVAVYFNMFVGAMVFLVDGEIIPFLDWSRMIGKNVEWQPLNDVNDFIDRVRAGEDFELNGARIYFDLDIPRSPFRIKEHSKHPSVWMDVEWDRVTEFTQHIPEQKWDDNLCKQNPVWCWVWDGDEKRHRTVMEVIDKNGGRYITIFDDGSSGPWDNAEPCSQLAGVNSDE